MTELPQEFKHLRIIRDNQRYCTYSAHLDGAHVFVKKTKFAKFTKNIHKELWGLDAFRQLSEIGDLPFAVPKVVSLGTDYVATSWAGGKTLSFDPDSESYDDEITFFAHSMASIDMLAGSVNPRRHEKSSSFQKSVDKLRNRLSVTEYSSFVDKALIDRAFEYLSANIGNVALRLTHADFTPNNVLSDGTTMTLIDYESVSLLWPRFYDIVNLTFNRMIATPNFAPDSRILIERYFNHNASIDIDDATQQMNIIALLRSLSLVYEYCTEPNDFHNTNATMSTEVANRISRAIEQILEGKSYFTPS